VGEATPRVPILLGLYNRYLEDRDLAAYVEQLSRSYRQGTLERLAQHPLREIRRAAVLALGFLGDYSANHTVGCALCDGDRPVRLLADTAIRSIWARAGDDSQRRELTAVVELNAARHYEEAIQRATALVEKADWYGEAWNQRAIAHFSLGHLQESIRDCHQTLEINPYHFAAAAGMGQAYLQLGNHACALECFRRALRLNPDLEAVRFQVARLSRLLEGT
jgi:tetratricopeptide (TPR) repeat protein